MSRQVYLHVGLHKTATRFLQRAVFQQLDPAEFEYNPQPLMRLFNQRLRRPGDEAVRAELQAEVERLMAGDDRKLLISKAGISGDMYDQHSGSRENLAIVKSLFPEARILYFVRNQADWLVSAYRQSIQKGAFGPMEVFLNYYDGEFRAKTAPRRAGMRNVEALGLRFHEIYQDYVQAYGEGNVYLFRYEDMRADRETFMARLARALDIETLPVSRPEKRRNRSYSALAIQLFCGGAKVPGQPPPPGDLQRGFLWRWRPARLLRNLRRSFIKYVFDPMIYRDWDLLARGGMREKIEAHYRDENEQIKQAARRN